MADRRPHSHRDCWTDTIMWFPHPTVFRVKSQTDWKCSVGIARILRSYKIVYFIILCSNLSFSSMIGGLEKSKLITAYLTRRMCNPKLNFCSSVSHSVNRGLLPILVSGQGSWVLKAVGDCTGLCSLETCLCEFESHIGLSCENDRLFPPMIHVCEGMSVTYRRSVVSPASRYGLLEFDFFFLMIKP